MEKSCKKKARILLIDDHPLFREGLRTILSRDALFEVAGEAGNAREGLDTARKIKPDVVTTDLSLPDQNGIELTAAIMRYLPKTLVMVISSHYHIDWVIQAIQPGAKGYLLKEKVFDSLIKAIDSLLKGEYFLDTALSNEYVKWLKNCPGFD